MSPRRPKPAPSATHIPTLATILASAALSGGCQRAEALAMPSAQSAQSAPGTQQEPAQSAPDTQQEPAPSPQVLPGQRPVADLSPQAMTIPIPAPPPQEETYFSRGGAMAMVRHGPRRYR